MYMYTKMRIDNNSRIKTIYLRIVEEAALNINCKFPDLVWVEEGCTNSKTHSCCGN